MPSKPIVAFQGIAGAYGEDAALALWGAQVARLPCATFDDVFACVEESRADVGVLPVENSLGGSVLAVYDLLLDHALPIVGEVRVAIRHCLLTPPTVRLEDVRRCWSHPQALAQCARFLRDHGMEHCAASNTAVAARDVARRAEADAAAIASERAGRLYGLEPRAYDVQMRDDNVTRFVAIARERPAALPADRASLVFGTRNEPGALLRCLQVFAEEGLNLTRLESRPTRGTPWEYFFHVDVEPPGGEGELTSELLSRLMHRLEPHAGFRRVLGCYPRWRSAERETTR